MLGLTFITFYEAGECASIEASKPCIVSVLESGGEMTVSVADPTHKASEIKLTLDGEYEAVNVPFKSAVEERDGKTVIRARTEGLTGEAVRVTLKK